MALRFTLECLICGDKGDGPHFGAVSCKACAAFFRRAVSQDLAHFCKTGMEKCTIDKTISPRNWCRKCRFLKCIRQGMDPTNVQPKRDKLLVERRMTSKRKLPSEETIEKSVNEPGLLQRLLKNYRFLRKTRRVNEAQLPNKWGNKVIGSGKLKGCRLASLIEINQAFHVNVPCVFEFVNSSFPEFANLSVAEKTMLMEPFLVLMFGIDNSYRTYQKVSKENYSVISIMGETLIFDGRETDMFLADCTATPSLRTDLKRIFKNNVNGKKKRIINLLGNMEIEEEEYVALLALMLWSPRIHVSTPDIDRIGRKIRNEIFQQLHEYYTSTQSMNNYAQRLGELTTVQSVVVQEMIAFREDMELFRLLDAFGQEIYFYKLIRNTRL